MNASGSSPRGRSPRPSETLPQRLWHLVLTPIAVGVCCLLAGRVPFAALLLLTMAAAGLAFASAWLLLRAASRTRARTEELDRQLLQTHKMAAIGEMSSGIAHEINTPLNIITQELEWLRHLLTTPQYAAVAASNDFADSLGQIEKQVQRCVEITHGMLNFARAMHTVGQSTDVSRLMEDMVLWVERENAGRDIRFVRNYAANLPEILTDAPMLRHVVLNLLGNAAQAIDHEGTVTVSTLREGNELLLRVEDDGPGIAPEHRDSIFNPFFTTKPPGKGTGLGLTICLAIVTRLGGSIEVHGAPGRGARFDVRLPATPAPDRAAGFPRKRRDDHGNEHEGEDVSHSGGR